MGSSLFFWALLWAPLSSFRVLLLVLPFHLGSAFGLLSISAPLLCFWVLLLLSGPPPPFGAALGSSFHLESLGPPSSFRLCFWAPPPPFGFSFGLLSLHFWSSSFWGPPFSFGFFFWAPPPFRSSLSIWALFGVPPSFGLCFGLLSLHLGSSFWGPPPVLGSAFGLLSISAPLLLLLLGSPLGSSLFISRPSSLGSSLFIWALLLGSSLFISAPLLCFWAPLLLGLLWGPLFI